MVRGLELLVDKSVALVGGGVCGEEELVGYDVVVRINNHWLRTGGRVDGVYHSGALQHVLAGELPKEIKMEKRKPTDSRGDKKC